MGQKHTLILLVRNRPGVLTRIAGLFRRRMVNIESLAVGHSERAGMSRMTIGLELTGFGIDQIVKQLYKLVDVVKVHDVSEADTVQRELALVMVECPPEKRVELFALAGTFRANVVDVGLETLTFEAVGSESKVDKLIDILSQYGVREIVRTGRVAMVRPESSVDDGRSELRVFPHVGVV